MEKGIEIYTTPEGVEVSVILEKDTLWATQRQMAELFETTPQNITIHLNNIYQEGEIEEQATCKESLQVQKEGKRSVKRKRSVYNLDAILSVGYRVNTKRGTQFRQWATQRLKDYLVKGYALNQKRLEQNEKQFLQTLDNLKILSQNNTLLEIPDVLSLIQNFSDTWFSLDQFDRNEFPKKGTKEEIQLSAKDLELDLGQLKRDLIKKGEATELFAQEKSKGNLKGIIGNVFQTVFGEDAYPTIEKKAAHLLYFVVKNHPFNDGNKRSGAFAFIWLLQKAGVNFTKNISPATLTTLTLLIAQSDPKEKDKMVGIILLLLNSDKK
jgi:death-on-curing family protein